jgi:hypothetical protein
MRRFVLILLVSLWVAPAYAHKPSDSYLMLSVEGRHLTGQWDIALRDLDYAIGLDTDGNSEITWGEVKAKHTEIAAYALAHLAIAADDAPCPMRVTEHLIDNHSDGAYEVMRFAGDCPAVPRVLTIRYTLFFDLDPQHRGLLRLEEQGRTHTAVFSPDRETWQLEGKHPAKAAMVCLSGGGSGFAQLPVPGEELVQLGDGLIGDAAQYGGEPSLRIDAVEFGRGDQGVHCCGPLSTTVGAGE